MAKKRLSKSSLLWFIRTRSYVSLPDLRRRFNIAIDHETQVLVGPSGRVYVGLPADTARMLQDLWREGKVGFELSIDVRAPVVLGIYSVNSRGFRATQAGRATEDVVVDALAEEGAHVSAD